MMQHLTVYSICNKIIWYLFQVSLNDCGYPELVRSILVH